MTELYDWQKDIINGMSSGKELKIMMTGRRVGKSTLNSAAFKRLWDDIYKERPVTDLILGESPVHGARYYTVQPEGGNWKDMEAWCKDAFGEPGDMWESNDWCWPETARWLQNNRKFWFRNERDRDWFIIRWNA